jgi:hypothetical protein
MTAGRWWRPIWGRIAGFGHCLANPMTGRRTFALAFGVTAIGADEIARPRRERGEGNSVLLVPLLYAGDLKVFQDPLRDGKFPRPTDRAPAPAPGDAILRTDPPVRLAL